MILGGTAEQVIRHAPCPVLIARSTRPEAKLRFRKILAPVDFSECSATGVKLAAECARKFRSDLRLFHAISSPNEILPDRRQSIVELGALNLRTARNEMRAFRRRHLPPSLRVETKLGGGEPIDLICDQVERHEIDLIVISTHGRTGFRRAIMGSVAEQVARHAKCSVIVVPSRCA
jgi:nucleotide-binding universal stress UspA family protein